MNTFDTIIYHSPCRDGLAAAWVASKFCPGIECIPATFGDPPPDVTCKRVLIADFSYSRDVLLDMVSKAMSILVLDHHKSAEEALVGLGGGNLAVKFDMESSGAGMVLDYFLDHDADYHPAEDLVDAMIRLVDYVEDRDLWQWKMPKSREVSAALDSYPLTFESFDKAAFQFARDGHFSLAEEGEAILRYQTRLIDRLVEDRRRVSLGGHSVWAVNTAVLMSEAANRLSEDPTSPFGITWYQNAEGLYCYSLRSRPEGSNFDTTSVAVPLGGGGHRNASGIRSKTPLW